MSLRTIIIYNNILLFYKIRNNHIRHDFNICNNFELHGYNTRNNMIIHLNNMKTNLGFNSTLENAARDYNTIPISLKNITSLHMFKKALKKYLETLNEYDT